MVYYISPGPLCDWCKYCTIPQYTQYHSEQFKPISISPVTGIVFKAYQYSATQLADAFEKLVSGHMDLEIKRQALDRWDMLFPRDCDGPMWRETEFELEDYFHVFDDFFFLRALRYSCRVEWVDECKIGWKRNMAGWCEWAEETNQGPVQWIRLVRPTTKKPRTIQDTLGTLMHEMCHAIFAFKCRCICCTCPLNKMNGEGLGGHGPSWEKLKRAVEDTAAKNLWWLPEIIRLCHPSEPQIEAEQEAVAKMLSGLYKKITQQGSEAAMALRLERAKRASDQAKILAEIEKEQTEEERLDAIACACAMFKRFERDSVLGALDRHVACTSAMIQISRPEKQVA